MKLFTFLLASALILTLGCYRKQKAVPLPEVKASVVEKVELKPQFNVLDSTLKLASLNMQYMKYREMELQANIDYNSTGGSKKYLKLFQ